MNWKSKLIKFWNIWPPFVGAGISITKTERDEIGLKVIESKLKLRFWNSNYVGTQFGGSLFAMTDAFLMVILVQRMGHSFIVWDKAATIRYKKPGKTDCFARFEVTDQELAAVRDEVNEKGRINWVRIVEIRDVAGDVVAEVEKTLYIATRAYYEAGRRAKEEEAARQKAALT